MYWVSEHLDKFGFHEFVQFVELAAAFGYEVADFIQNRRDFVLFVKRWYINLSFRQISKFNVLYHSANGLYT